MADKLDNWYSYKSGGVWTSVHVEVDALTSNGKAGSIALDGNNKPRLSYMYEYHPSLLLGRLKYSSII